MSNWEEKSIHDTLNVKIQERFVYWGVHDILDADDTAELACEIEELVKQEILSVIEELRMEKPETVDAPQYWQGMVATVNELNTKLEEIKKRYE